MAKLTEFTTKLGALWVQPSGPNTLPEYLGCHDLGPLTIPEGTTEYQMCFNNARDGWDVVGKTGAPPGKVTVAINTFLFPVRDYLEKVRCPFSLYILQRDCGAANVFTNYIRGEVLTNVTRTQRTYTNLVHRSADTPSDLGVTLEASPDVIDVDDLSVSRLATVEVNSYNGITANTESQCADECGAKLDVGQDLGISMDAGAGVANFNESVDFGDTLTAHLTTFAVTKHIMGITRFRVGKTTVRYLLSEAAGAAGAHTSYTDDRGGTWSTPIDLPGNVVGHGTLSGKGLWSNDEKHIWLASGLGFIYKSVDGGASFYAVESGIINAAAGSYTSIHFCDNDYGIAVGVAGITALSSDGGESWIAGGVVDGGAHVLYGCYRIDEDNMWVTCAGGQVFYSDNGGVTWHERIIPGIAGVAGNTKDIMFLKDEHTGFLVNNNAAVVGKIYHTINGGHDWQGLTTPANLGLNCIWVAEPWLAYAVGTKDAGPLAVILKVDRP